MNWFKQHLNWTIFLAVLGAFIIYFFTEPRFSFSESDILPFFIRLITLIATFIVFGWVLHSKNRDWCWLLLAWTPIGWIIYLVLDNRTIQINATEKQKCLGDYQDEVKCAVIQDKSAEPYNNTGLHP
jgi:polyferredoxin